MRPAEYTVTVFQAPRLVSVYQDEAPPESRLKGLPVVELAHRIDIWLQAAWHRRWERLPFRFTIFVTIAVLVASAFEIVPTFLIRSNVPTIATVKPLTPLEVAGRDIYIAEGCYNCHSQMIRPILSETKRYGEYSKPGEFVYDHPFQWGSRRIGPDLAREGGKQSSFWHVLHLENPRQINERSIMPAYPWLLQKKVAFDSIPAHLNALSKVGVPYDEPAIAASTEHARKQAAEIAAQIVSQGGPASLDDKQVVALVAYLQRLGTDLFAAPAPPPAGSGAIAAAAPAMAQGGQ